MGVEIGTAKAGKMFEAADYAAISETFEVGAAHIGDEGWVGTKGAHGETGIIGIGQHVDNGHEIYV